MTHPLDADNPDAGILRTANIRLQRQLKAATVKRDDMIEAIFQAASAAACRQGLAVAPKPETEQRRKNIEIALVHATDFQCGKISPTFNMGILADRIALFSRKIARITEIQRSDHPVKECVLMLGGDMVEGIQIFPGQVYEVEAGLYDQTFACARIIEQLCVDLLAAFERVRVITEYGNHGRLGRKGDYPVVDNIDRMVYAIVESRFGGEKRISFAHSSDFFNTVEIGNYRALLIHGDEIGSAGGIVRKCTSWASGAIPWDFKDVYIGHFHTPQTLALPNAGRAFVTGSPESANSYAAEVCAATGTPSQRLHYIDPERGRVTSEHTIWLEG